MFFNKIYTVAEDVDFNLRYLKYCDGCVYLPQKLYAYVLRSDSATQSYLPDRFAMHLMPFYARVPFVGEENLVEYCDFWLGYFITLFKNVFDKRNQDTWLKKMCYNQRMLASKEFQFCLQNASGKNESPIIINLLKTKNYFLFWSFQQAHGIYAGIRNKFRR